jgi:hypothetical protein
VRGKARCGRLLNNHDRPPWRHARRRSEMRIWTSDKMVTKTKKETAIADAYPTRKNRKPSS